MSDKESDPLDDLNRRYQELNISGKYSFNYGLLRIVDVTIHSVRQSWILLKESLPYDLSFYLDEGKKFPDFNHMKRYVKFSSLAVRLLEYTINKVKDAKLSKVYAIADEYNSSTIDFYTKHGFHRSSSTFPDVVSNLKVSRPDSNVSPSFIIMELPLATPETK
uniref:Uncharacterized protein n=1 Tax=Theileria parva TaxID=5875 RepID=Q4N1L8_THEPA|eukprot:XP_764353.1 hypothetical protein [Theileria parva strain Muguga]